MTLRTTPRPLTHVASGGGYGGVSKRLPVTVIDDDEPDLVLSVSSLGIAENADATYTVKLATRPSGPVTVTLGGTAGTDLSLVRDEPELHRRQLERGADGDRKRGRRRGRRGRHGDADP